MDVAFSGDDLPQLDEALVIEWDRPAPLIVEVQAHLNETTIRGVALQSTAGLQRGTPVRATAGSITVPVGDAVLGRLLDATGNVRDNGPPLAEGTPRGPIHRSAPALADRSAATAIFETGINSLTFSRRLLKAAKPPCSVARVSVRQSW